MREVNAYLWLVNTKRYTGVASVCNTWHTSYTPDNMSGGLELHNPSSFQYYVIYTIAAYVI